MADCCECGSNGWDDKSSENGNGNDQCKVEDLETPGCDLKRCKSYELRGGVYYMTCDCIKRNGLQDDCRRTCCQGSCECQTRPEPTCCPSKFPKKLALMLMGVKKPEKERIF